MKAYSDKVDYKNLFVPLKKLGEGSFGKVYLVKQKDAGKYYAMKVLSKSRIYQNDIAKYILTERKVQSTIKSRFIVKIHCAFQTKSKLFMIMDYCPGGDLRTALKTNRKFTEPQAKIYAAEVLLALEELHKQKIIHRDLKLDNVVLDKNGHALLTDFGLSKKGIQLGDNTGTFCGTMQYLAPEILEGLGHGHSVDWYLFGTFLYEMIVGYPPFFDRNRNQVKTREKNLNIPESMSPEASDIIVKLLNNNPKKRLGAGVRDAEEIKAHVFFNNINWEKAAEGKLKPPKPYINQVVKVESLEDVYEDNEVDVRDRLDGWSFRGKRI